MDEDILTASEDNIVNVLLFGKPNSDNAINMALLNLTIEFITSSERSSFVNVDTYPKAIRYVFKHLVLF